MIESINAYIYLSKGAVIVVVFIAIFISTTNRDNSDELHVPLGLRICQAMSSFSTIQSIWSMMCNTCI